MAGSKQAIKNRIRSINSTKKITKAMELIAISKLKRQRDLFDANRQYAESLRDIVADILANTHDIDNMFLQDRKDDEPLYVVFLSDLGLCGGYNINMIHMIMDKIPVGSKLLAVGTRGRGTLADNGYRIMAESIGSDDVKYNELFKLAADIIQKYIRNEITSINIAYTEYVNSMSFVPKLVRLLPIAEAKKQGAAYKEIIYEPNANTILDKLIPLYVESLVYSYWLETTTSEHSARRMAMDLATDNAEELIDDLTLAYNRARQAAITQEINEIELTADAV